MVSLGTDPFPEPGSVAVAVAVRAHPGQRSHRPFPARSTSPVPRLSSAATTCTAPGPARRPGNPTGTGPVAKAPSPNGTGPVHSKARWWTRPVLSPSHFRSADARTGAGCGGHQAESQGPVPGQVDVLPGAVGPDRPVR